jgi:ribosomal protein L24
MSYSFPESLSQTTRSASGILTLRKHFLIHWQFSKHSVLTQWRNEINSLFSKIAFMPMMAYVDIPFDQLSSTTILASSQELEFFHHSSYWARAKPFPCHSRVGDRVRVVAGTLQGISGFVMEVKELTVRFTPKEDHDVVHEVQLTDIRKQFEPGDFVEIIEGLDCGAQGFVINSDNINASLIIYSWTVSIVHTSRRDVNQIEQQGREVSIPGSLGV